MHKSLKQELENAQRRISELEARSTERDVRTMAQDNARRDLEGRCEALTADLKQRDSKIAALVENEAFLIRCSRMANLGYAIWDEVKGRDAYVSDELASIHGFTTEDYIKSITSLESYVSYIHPEDREPYQNYMIDLEKGINDSGLVYRFVKPDGSVRHLRDLSKFLDAPSGEAGHSTVVIQDVTDRKEIEQRLHLTAAVEEREALLTQSADMAHLGYAVWDEINLNYISISGGYAAIHGCTKEDYLRTYDTIEKGLEIIHPEDRARYLDYVNWPPDRERDDTFIEYRIVIPDGEIKHIFQCFQYITDEDGQITQSINTIQDITDRKEAEANLLQAKQMAESANRAKSEFLANMSHELRTPLNAIIGLSEVISQENYVANKKDRYGEYVAAINNSGNHLLSLINDILDLSKIDAGQEELQEEPLNVIPIVHSVSQLVQRNSGEDTKKIELSIPDGLPLLHADERRLKQILVNLLSNAMKFTNEEGKVMLKVRCNSDSGHVFQIIDNGIGIASGDLPKALSQFGQVEDSLSRSHQGTGLGLPLAKSLVEMHGGVLDLKSQPGVGTTVTVSLPKERIVSPVPDSAATTKIDR